MGLCFRLFTVKLQDKQEKFVLQKQVWFNEKWKLVVWFFNFDCVFLQCDVLTHFSLWCQQNLMFAKQRTRVLSVPKVCLFVKLLSTLCDTQVHSTSQLQSSRMISPNPNALSPQNPYPLNRIVSLRLNNSPLAQMTLSAWRLPYCHDFFCTFDYTMYDMRRWYSVCRFWWFGHVYCILG